MPASESAEPPTLRLAPRVGGNPSAASPLIAEFRSSEASGHTFSLVLRTDADGPVTLHATGLNSFSEQTVFLVDPSAGASHNLRRASAPTIRPQNESHTLHLLVGTAAYVEAKKRVTLPRTVQFLPPSPNPFGRRATLTYVLPSPGPVRLVVYDLLGRRVRVLVDRRQQAGRHTVTWHGRDPSGRRVASGVYLARLSASSVSKVRKMTFVR